jgi:DNA-directed RNA polymerase subunit K/omega
MAISHIMPGLLDFIDNKYKIAILVIKVYC